MANNGCSKNWRVATKLVHGGSMRSQFNETSEGLFLTQGYVYDSAEIAEARFNGEDDGYVYSRYANPTVSMFEERMCQLEGAQAGKATATGMAAVSAAIACQVKAGDHIVAARALFGSCRWVLEVLMPKFGVETTLVDGGDLDQWHGAMRENTKVCFLESPTNPTLDLVDIEGVAKIAHEVGARVIVDNVFSTPIWQSPLELGADIVVYSTTKHVDGQGRCLGGIVLADQEFIDEEFFDYFRHTGPSLSPFNAWTMLKGMETLDLRVRRQTQSAEKIADFLALQKGVKSVKYPHRSDHPQFELAKRQMKGGSTLVAFELEGGKPAAFRFENALETILLSNNLGDAKSLITHPATTTHKNLKPEEQVVLGITDGLLRLSIGLEDCDDLCEDLAGACAAAIR